MCTYSVQATQMAAAAAQRTSILMAVKHPQSARVPGKGTGTAGSWAQLPEPMQLLIQLQWIKVENQKEILTPVKYEVATTSQKVGDNWNNKLSSQPVLYRAKQVEEAQEQILTVNLHRILANAQGNHNRTIIGFVTNNHFFFFFF